MGVCFYFGACKKEAESINNTEGICQTTSEDLVVHSTQHVFIAEQQRGILPRTYHEENGLSCICLSWGYGQPCGPSTKGASLC